MTQIFSALFISSMIILSIYGNLYATYALIGVLSINVVLIIYTSSIIIGFFKFILKNNEKYLNIVNVNTGDHVISFLIKCILLIAIYQIYIQDYVFLAGLATSTVMISLLESMIKLVNLED
jgi:hypothetical protein